MARPQSACDAVFVVSSHGKAPVCMSCLMFFVSSRVKLHLYVTPCVFREFKWQGPNLYVTPCVGRDEGLCARLHWLTHIFCLRARACKINIKLCLQVSE